MARWQAVPPRLRRLTAGQERIDDPLIKFKFLCTQFWTALFGRKVDGLKTNRRVRHSPAVSHVLQHRGFIGHARV